MAKVKKEQPPKGKQGASKGPPPKKQKPSNLLSGLSIYTQTTTTNAAFIAQFEEFILVSLTRSFSHLRTRSKSSPSLSRRNTADASQITQTRQQL